MPKFFYVLFLIAGFAFVLPKVAAESAPTAKKSIKKKPQKKATTKKIIAVKKRESTVDAKGMSSSYYHCEQGNKLTIITKPNDDKLISIRWRNLQYKLLRVSTTTGADRFEDQSSGLVWISIPTKGILLDAHKGRQLANECNVVAKNPVKKQ